MKISPKCRADFCRWFLTLGNAGEAARRAGLPPDCAETEGMRLLQMPACRKMLSEFSASPPLPMQSLVISGLARLAFGSANDAVRLLFAEEAPDADTLAQLDLFHVTSYKHDRNGFEIKLADRQRAMEKLLEIAEAADSAAAANALLSALSGDGGGEEVPDDIECTDIPAVFPEAAEGNQLVAAEENTAL